jgi:4-amino-4-deoxy-L-arabinose transferase-like glycosyltransferase
MRGWLGVFGDSELTALSLPLLLGTALIPTAHYLGTRVFSCYTGTIAALFIAAAPLLAIQSGYVRPYSLLPLLCLVSVYLLWRGLAGGGPGIWAAQASIGLAMLLTHNWAWMVFGAEAVAVAICLATGRLRSGMFRNWLLAQGAVLVGFAPWITALRYQVRNAGYGSHSVNLLEAISVFAEMTTSLPAVIVVGLLVLIVVAAVGLLRGRRAQERMAPFLDQWGTDLLLFAGIPVIAFTAAVILSYRNNLYHKVSCPIMLSPCIIIVIAFLIASWSSWPRVVGGLVASTYLISSVGLLGWQKANTAALARVVSARAAPSDIVVVAPCWFASSFDYYFKSKNVQIIYPYNFAAGPIFYDRLRDRLLAPAPMAQFRAEIGAAYETRRRIWLVNVNEIVVVPRIAPEYNTVPRENQNLCYTELGYSRANQITELIESEYGKPSAEICPNRDRAGPEILRASLYCRLDSWEGR